MLTSLTVKNLALVDRVSVEFGPGLNVITGETGAGKSILIGALGLVLGERADKGLIRTGETECSAQAVFALADCQSIDAVLDEHGVDPCEDGQLILRRVVKATGGSRNLVNDCAVTLTVMKAVGRLLVDMHGPHDHQSLFDPDFQLSLLDAFGRNGSAVAAYQEAYGALQELASRKQALEGPEEGVAEQMDMLAYRIKELEDAALDPEEEASVLREQHTLGNAQEIQVLGQVVVDALQDAEGSAFDAVAAAQRALSDLKTMLPEAAEWSEEANAISIQLQELHRSVSSAVGEIESDPARLQWLDDRLGVYQAMKRKYGGSVEEARATLERSRERLKDLSSRGERLAEIEAEMTAAEADVRTLGKALRKKRQAAAGKLAKAVTGELVKLGFEHGRFAVEVRDGGLRPSGLDDVEYGFAPNVGESMRPLRSIASSGEISRVMLATKGVLAGLDKIPVLVFDEIDANVGGEMGTVVGQALGELGGSHQVLCITHLPQVAVCGSSHFAVAKSVKGGRTFTSVDPLDEGARAEEVARMLGGKGLTKVTLRHAREMLGHKT